MNHYYDDAIKDAQDERITEVYKHACEVQEARYISIAKMRAPFLTDCDILLSRGFIEQLVHAAYQGHQFWRVWYRELLKENNAEVSCP